MLSYILRRLALMIPTLFGVLAVVFFVMAYSPGGFGGVALDQGGSMTAGDDAKRIKKRLERRYGADLPKIAQFGRWVNQISPIGFRMSGNIKFDDADRDLVAERLADLPFNTRDSAMRSAIDLTLDLAAYRGITPEASADELRTALLTPSKSVAIFDWIEADLDPGIQEDLEQELAGFEAEGRLGLAQKSLISELAFETSGVQRIRFDLPGFKKPDLGESLRGRRVSELLGERVPITLLLNFLTVPIIYIVAVTAGIYAARHQGGFFDLTSGLILVALWSIPVIWAGMLLINFLANEEQLKWFPTTGLHDLQADAMRFLPAWVDDEGVRTFERGWLLDVMWHLVLPVFCLTYGGFAVIGKVTRGAVLDALTSDYVRTARAKGVHERHILWRHVFRNSLLPLITMFANILPALFVGSVVVETIFSINGMGKLGVEAAFAKDREVVMATTLIAALLKLVSELLRDICYALADPRVTYD